MTANNGHVNLFYSNQKDGVYLLTISLFAETLYGEVLVNSGRLIWSQGEDLQTQRWWWFGFSKLREVKQCYMRKLWMRIIGAKYNCGQNINDG